MPGLAKLSGFHKKLKGQLFSWYSNKIAETGRRARKLTKTRKHQKTTSSRRSGSFPCVRHTTPDRAVRRRTSNMRRHMSPIWHHMVTVRRRIARFQQKPWGPPNSIPIPDNIKRQKSTVSGYFRRTSRCFDIRAGNTKNMPGLAKLTGSPKKLKGPLFS